MALARQGKNQDGTTQFSGSTWGRDFTGSFAVDGPLPAVNPAYAAEAAAFEAKLGALAFARGQPAAEAVAAKAVTYMQQRAAITSQLGDAGKSLDDLYKACGYDSPGWAGAVGKAPDQVMEALTKGNIRERLTAVQGFVENVLINDTINAGDQQATLMDLMKQAGFHTQQLQDFQNSGSTSKWDSPFHKPDQKEGSQVGNVDVNRANRDELGMPAVDQRTQLTTKTVTTPLSDAEKKMQGVAGPDPAEGQRLAWMEGAKKILLNEEDKWVKLWRGLSVPLKGGPSGHTYKFMQANQILGAGVSPDEMRLACLGYLLPINAHSMIEVMEAARTFGASPFPNDQTVYRYVSPLSEGELRSCGTDNRFPDEPPGTAQKPTAAVGGQPDQSSVPAELRTGPQASTGTGTGNGAGGSSSAASTGGGGAGSAPPSSNAA